MNFEGFIKTIHKNTARPGNLYFPFAFY